MPKLSVNQTLAKAATYARRGQIEQAKVLYKSILETYPNNRQAMLKLTDLSVECGAMPEQGFSKDNNQISKETEINKRFQNPAPLEHADFFRPGMGTENVGGLLRSMVQMLRPKRILEIGA